MLRSSASPFFRGGLCLIFFALILMVIQPSGLIYTNIRLPLTKNLQNTPVPILEPPTGRVLEVKEPFTGFGFYARVDSNAVGDIAKKNGMETVYFADQEIFSILGVWTTTRTIVYGK